MQRKYKMQYIKKIIICCCVLLLSPLAFGVISDVHITGFIVKYDKDTVQLQQRGNRTITVPRSAIPKDFPLKTGREVTVVISGKEFMKRINQKQVAAKKETQKISLKPQKKKTDVKK